MEMCQRGEGTNLVTCHRFQGGFQTLDVILSAQKSKQFPPTLNIPSAYFSDFSAVLS